MAARQTGKQGAIFVEDAHDFDPQSGDTYSITWKGPKAAIMSKGAQYRAAGWRVSRRKSNGPVYMVTASTGTAPGQAPGGPEVPIDRYRIVTQNAQLDIRSNHYLITLAGTEAKLAKWVVDANTWLNDAANSGADRWAGTGWSANQMAVADLVARGQQSYQLKRPVLTRIRSVSANYPNQFVVSPVEVIYSTTALVNRFLIPQKVKIRLPLNPATKPTNTQWGWLWDQQDSDIIPVTNRVEEMDTWIFAAWSTLTYTYVAA